ncbi:sulfatase-like hydrolase/transferase [Bacteroidota bacterium]
MKRFVYIWSIAFLFLGCENNKQSQKKQNKSKPNIVVILIDDAGYADFGFMGSKELETPNIDKLAKSGVVFTDAHTSSNVCAPSRAGLISGKYQQRFGFECNGTGDKKSGEIGLVKDVTTIADAFKQNDYKTIALGKWHLGSLEDDYPYNRGFDEFYGFLGGSRSYFPIKNPTRKQMLQKNGERVVFDGYLTDVLTDRATVFMEENKGNPFFMYMAYNAVHTPMQAKKEDLKKFEGHPRQMLAAMTWSLDENVGKLVSKLETLGVLENTLIFFLSDNGGATTNNSDNGLLKGFKGNHYEGGHRVPFFLSWNGKVDGNKTFDGLTSSLDIFKTSIAAANIIENESWGLDGANLLSYVAGEQQGEPHDQLFWRKGASGAARIGDNKLVYHDEYGGVLYNLSADLGETTDLSKTKAQTFRKINEAYRQWEADKVTPLWMEKQFWQNRDFEIHRNLMQNKFRTAQEMYQFEKNK